MPVIFKKQQILQDNRMNAKKVVGGKDKKLEDSDCLAKGKGFIFSKRIT